MSGEKIDKDDIPKKSRSKTMGPFFIILGGKLVASFSVLFDAFMTHVVDKLFSSADSDDHTDHTDTTHTS